MPDPTPIRPVFVLCVERGILERTSLLLARTIRRFGGAAASARIVACAPRAGHGPSASTRDRLRDERVELLDADLNREWTDYPFANKVVACAHVSDELASGGDGEGPAIRLVFLDSDTLVLRPPERLLAPGEAPILRPVERRIGGTGGDDEHATYWKRIFEWAGVDTPMRVRTTLDDESILGYWNAGLVAGTVGSGLFTLWLDRFRGLLDADLVHPMGMTFMDQISLALAVRDLGMPPEDPGPLYNTPVDASGTPASVGGDLAEVVIAHYHHTLNHTPFADPLSALLNDERAPELRGMIRAAGLAGPGAWLTRRVRNRFGG